MPETYTVRDWIIKRGRGQEFEYAWRTFAKWLIEQKGFSQSVRLFKDGLDPAHYMSIESWESETARAVIESGVQFGKQSYRLQQLAIDFSSRSFTLKDEEVGHSSRQLPTSLAH